MNIQIQNGLWNYRAQPRIIPRGSLSQLLRVRGSKIKKIWWKDSRRGIYMVLCVLWYIVLKHFRGKIKCIFKSSSPSTPKPLTRNCNPEAWTVKGGRSEVQSHSRWHSEFKISLGCMRSCLNKQKLKPQTNTKSFFPHLCQTGIFLKALNLFSGILYMSTMYSDHIHAHSLPQSSQVPFPICFSKSCPLVKKLTQKRIVISFGLYISHIVSHTLRKKSEFYIPHIHPICEHLFLS